MEIIPIASGSAGNCYLISDGQTSLMLDAGVQMRKVQEMIGFCVGKTSAVLLTHEHQDHAKAVRVLLQRGIDVYTSKGTADALGLTGHRVHRVPKLERFTVGTMTVLPFDVQHDCAEPFGFLISSTKTKERLLYFTDTYYIKYKFNGLTHIMGECNHSLDLVKQSVEEGMIPAGLAPRLVKSHMSLEHFCELLKANDLSMVRSIYLLHLSNNNADAGYFLETVKKLTGRECYVL